MLEPDVYVGSSHFRPQGFDSRVQRFGVAATTPCSGLMINSDWPQDHNSRISEAYLDGSGIQGFCCRRSWVWDLKLWAQSWATILRASKPDGSRSELAAKRFRS